MLNVDLDIPASHIIWTVQFDGLDGVNGSQAALILSGDSINTSADFNGVGSSYDDFWQKNANGWKLHRSVGDVQMDDNFSAKLTAYDKDTVIVKYTPNDNETGSDSFTYEVIDNNGGTGTGTVNITLAPNNSPVANNQYVEVSPGIATSIDLDVSDFDYDTLYIDITQMPANGLIGGVSYNSKSEYGQYFNSIGKEVGDEIKLSLENQILTTFAFEYWSDIDVLTQSATGTIKIYSKERGEEHDGLGDDAIEPNRLLYVSNKIDIKNGFNSVVLDDILLAVPSEVIWTFEVSTSDEIKAGEPVCIVEAMKLFNEIESDVSGKIVKVLVDDATPVEYDQPMFLVEPA